MKLKHEEEAKLQVRGRWRLTALYKGTDKVHEVIEGSNLIVLVGKVLVGKMLQDISGYDTGITYHAIGSDDTAVDVGDTTLTVEEARKAVTAKTQSSAPNTNEFTWSTFYSAGESTYVIEEAGVFGHDASSTPDSGDLFSHYLVAFDNSGGNYDLIFDYILTIG